MVELWIAKTVLKLSRVEITSISRSRISAKTGQKVKTVA